MKIYLYAGAAAMLVAAGWCVRGWRDDALAARYLATAQVDADRRRQVDEAREGALAKRLNETEEAYAAQEKRIFGKTLVRPSVQGCSGKPLFSAEFVGLWNRDPR
jgi:hypothetical protein